MTTTQIPGYGVRYGDVHPTSILIDPEARMCDLCGRFVPSGLLAGHRDQCPLPVADDACEHGLTLVARDDTLPVGPVLVGIIVEARCAFCATTDDLSFEEDPFAADVYNDHAPLWICGPCISDRKDEV